MKSRKITEKAVIITAAIGGVLILIMLIANTYWAYEQYGIWGLTARFLVRFKEILLAGEYQPTWKR